MNLVDDGMPPDLRFGTVFYIEKFGPFKDPTLLLLSANSGCEDKLVLVVSGGHKRGSLLQVLPLEAHTSATSISRMWVIENWSKWIDIYSSAESVIIIPDILEAMKFREHREES
ncbi:MAG: Imm45 family immunity protein [Paracoccaceae bacterium]